MACGVRRGIEAVQVRNAQAKHYIDVILDYCCDPSALYEYVLAWHTQATLAGQTWFGWNIVVGPTGGAALG